MAILRFLPIIVMVVLLVAAIVDLVRIDPSRVRALPKGLWAVIIVVLFFYIGPILWFALGRERLARRGAGRGPVAPDDDPEFLRRIANDEQQNQRIRDLEQQLSELDVDPDEDTPKP
jgi:hypothetical protein